MDAFHLRSLHTTAPDHQIGPDDSSAHEDGSDRGKVQHAFTDHHALLERNHSPNRDIYPAAEQARRKAKGKDEAPKSLLNVESNKMLNQSAHNIIAVSQ